MGISSTSGAQKPNDEDYHLFFSRKFPGSIPEYFEVEIEKSSKAIYREGSQEEPLEFELTAGDLSQLEKHIKPLDYFRFSLVHNRKVAFTGEKIFRYTDAGGNSFETKFNHTENSDAKALVTWFLNVSETLRHRIELERLAQFDRLGVNKRLLQFQISLDKGRIVAPKQMLPVLRRISKDMKIMHLSRSRAAGIVHRIEQTAGE